MDEVNEATSTSKATKTECYYRPLLFFEAVRLHVQLGEAFRQEAVISKLLQQPIGLCDTRGDPMQLLGRGAVRYHPGWQPERTGLSLCP